MRWRVVLWVSLGLNVALAVWLWRASHLPSQTSALPVESEPIIVHSNLVRTNLVVRRQNFVWNQIESDEYPIFIANLRFIGCPEATIRDIIVADVNQHFAQRQATEVVSPSHQWWRSDPDPEIAQLAATKTAELETERRTLLTQLLGPEWESADYPYPESSSQTPLDGVLLGDLPLLTKVAVRQIEREARDRHRDYVAAQAEAGAPPDPVELARLDQQTLATLATVLTPEQLEEYRLRYSPEARELRSTLSELDTTPEEFRLLFGRIDPIQRDLQLAAETSDPASAERRDTLIQQRNEALAEVLGVERLQIYEMSQDPLFRQAQTVVEQAGVKSEKILSVAALYRVGQLEEQRIRNDVELTEAQRIEYLRAAQAAQLESLRELLGEAAYLKYLNSNEP